MSFGFCDVILVNDQQSEDDSREIARRFSKVVWLESPDSKICEQARWQLLDAPAHYDGTNLIWCTDADELAVAAAHARVLRSLDRNAAA